jgi:hypothetical protein
MSAWPVSFARQLVPARFAGVRTCALRRLMAAAALALALALAALRATPCHGEVPTPADFEAAVDAARPLGTAQDLVLRTDGLWLELLRSGTPMMASRRGQDCHIGYSAFVAQRRFQALFPPGPQDQAAAWLGALVHHELMHCANAAPAGSTALAGAGAAPRNAMAVWLQEAIADLAFAHHLDGKLPEAEARALITRLIDIRAGAAARDPDHDTAAVLRCYLAHPQRRVEAQPDARPWLPQLQVWQAHCPALRPG